MYMCVHECIFLCLGMCVCVYICVMIMIIQEISIAHNLVLKAGAQCAHRKTQNELPIKTKRHTKHTITTTP